MPRIITRDDIQYMMRNGCSGSVRFLMKKIKSKSISDWITYTEDVDIIKMLIRRNKDIVKSPFYAKQHVLNVISSKRDSTLLDYCIKKGMAIDYQFLFDNALYAQDLPFMKKLIKRGSSRNLAQQFLSRAFSSGNEDIILYFLSRENIELTPNIRNYIHVRPTYKIWKALLNNQNIIWNNNKTYFIKSLIMGFPIKNKRIINLILKSGIMDEEELTRKQIRKGVIVNKKYITPDMISNSTIVDMVYDRNYKEAQMLLKILTK